VVPHATCAKIRPNFQKYSNKAKNPNKISSENGQIFTIWPQKSQVSNLGCNHAVRVCIALSDLLGSTYYMQTILLIVSKEQFYYQCAISSSHKEALWRWVAAFKSFFSFST